MNKFSVYFFTIILTLNTVIAPNNTKIIQANTVLVHNIVERTIDICELAIKTIKESQLLTQPEKLQLLDHLSTIKKKALQCCYDVELAKLFDDYQKSHQANLDANETLSKALHVCKTVDPNLIADQTNTQKSWGAKILPYHCCIS